MSVMSTDNRVATSTGLLPRVNLLPPEIAEKKAFQRIQLGLGAAVIASLGVVGLLYMSAAHDQSAAQAHLDAATARQTALQAETAKYADVTATYAKATAAQAELTSAMGDEIRFSEMLNDLSMAVPSTVWIKSLNYTTATPSAAAPAAPGAVPNTIGTMSVTGVGFTHLDVALWLDSLGKLKTLTNPSFSGSTRALIGSKPTTNFTSTASITSQALSGRYATKAGG